MITETVLSYKEAPKSKEIEFLLSQPSSITIQKQLSAIGSATLVYPLELHSAAFQESTGDRKTNLPREIRISSKQTVGKSTQEHQLFRGFLEFYQMNIQDRSLTLFFLDPLVTATEIDEPQPFHNQSLDRIVKKLFDNAFAKQKDSQSIQVEFLNPPVQVENATNMGITDFEFIKSLSDEFGFSFFYDHSNSKSEKVKFLIPDFSKPVTRKLEVREIETQASFAASMHRFLNKAVVHGSSGKSEVPLSQYESSFSKFFKDKAKSRTDNGVELISHFYRPNLSTHSTQAIAKARIMECSYKGDRLSFQSQHSLQVGEYFEIVDTDQKRPNLTPLLGAYLVKETVSTKSGSGWIHSYVGVRP